MDGRGKRKEFASTTGILVRTDGERGRSLLVQQEY